LHGGDSVHRLDRSSIQIFNDSTVYRRFGNQYSGAIINQLRAIP
jgi:hypothetical protein